MTREEAIYKLRVMQAANDGAFEDSVKEGLKADEPYAPGATMTFREFFKADHDAYDMAIKALEAPPNDNWEGYSKRLWKSAYERGKADAEQRWIPVSERLPEERDWYLAVFKESDTGFQLIPRVADYIGMGENKWQLMYEDSLSSEYLDLLECVAWMPLPEPYKAESENKE